MIACCAGGADSSAGGGANGEAGAGGDAGAGAGDGPGGDAELFNPDQSEVEEPGADGADATNGDYLANKQCDACVNNISATV